MFLFCFWPELLFKGFCGGRTVLLWSGFASKGLVRTGLVVYFEFGVGLSLFDFSASASKKTHDSHIIREGPWHTGFYRVHRGL